VPEKVKKELKSSWTFINELIIIVLKF
jgi:hypothetical protein